MPISAEPSKLGEYVPRWDFRKSPTRRKKGRPRKRPLIMNSRSIKWRNKRSKSKPQKPWLQWLSERYGVRFEQEWLSRPLPKRKLSFDLTDLRTIVLVRNDREQKAFSVHPIFGDNDGRKDSAEY